MLEKTYVVGKWVNNVYYVKKCIEFSYNVTPPPPQELWRPVKPATEERVPIEDLSIFVMKKFNANINESGSKHQSKIEWERGRFKGQQLKIIIGVGGLWVPMAPTNPCTPFWNFN